MNIRPLEDSDLPVVRLIHTKYFSDEFAFPNFNDKILCKFVVEDDNGQIVCAAAVRAIAEVILVTDKEVESREKWDALIQVLNASTYMTNANEFTQLHAFVQDDIWHSILNRVGFKDCKGDALVINCR